MSNRAAAKNRVAMLSLICVIDNCLPRTFVGRCEDV
jgi:hypothetical protein